jgi:hypothetical protein
LVGVPVKFRDVVVADCFCVTPAGSAPETMDHLYGVQPPLALMTAEYGVWTVPFGSVEVLIVM